MEFKLQAMTTKSNASVSVPDTKDAFLGGRFGSEVFRDLLFELSTLF